MNLAELRRFLTENSDGAYSKFSAALVPHCGLMTGVRLSLLRGFARRIVRDAPAFFKAWSESFCKAPDSNAFFRSFEEKMLFGMALGLLNMPFEEIEGLVKKFIESVDNWSICDSFCAGFGSADRQHDAVWSFIREYFDSSKEFDVRFAYVMMLDHYARDPDRQRLDECFSKFDAPIIEKFYARAGAAWALSKFFILYPERTLSFMSACRLDDETFAFGVRKIRESRRVSAEMKEAVLNLKRDRIQEGAIRNSKYPR